MDTDVHEESETDEPVDIPTNVYSDIRGLLLGELELSIDFNGEESTLSYNDDGEESFYLFIDQGEIYFTSVEQVGSRSYFLKNNGQIVMCVDFSDDEKLFEYVLRFLSY